MTRQIIPRELSRLKGERMIKHTDGPWICHSGMVWKDDPEGWPHKDPGVDLIPIARMDREAGNGTQPTERDANARLIAAAPDLLHALEQAQLVLDTIPHEQRVAVPGISRFIRAAIAKARGE